MGMQNTALFLNLILFSAFHGFVIGAIILAKDKMKSRSNIIFAIILFLFSLYLFEFYAAYNRIWPRVLTFATYPSLFFIGPLLYFYKSSLLDKKITSKTILAYISPAILIYIAFLPYYYINYAIPRTGCPFSSCTFVFYIRYLLAAWLFPAYTLLFLFFIYIKFSRENKKKVLSKKTDSHLFNQRSKWFKKLLLILLLFFFLNTVYEFLKLFSVLEFSGTIRIIQYFVLSLIIHAIGYWILINPAIFTNIRPIENGAKYKTSSVDKEIAATLLSEIIDYLEQKKPFLAEEMTLQTLANETGISKHKISQVINQELNTSFFNLINKYRIEEVIKILSKKDRPRTVEDLAFSVGFSNKVSFYRAFKNITGESFTNFKKRV